MVFLPNGNDFDMFEVLRTSTLLSFGISRFRDYNVIIRILVGVPSTIMQSG